MFVTPNYYYGNSGDLLHRREVLKQGMTVHILEPGYFMTNLLDMDTIERSLRNSYSQTDQKVQEYYGNDFVDEGEHTIQVVG